MTMIALLTTSPFPSWYNVQEKADTFYLNHYVNGGINLESHDFMSMNYSNHA